MHEYELHDHLREQRLKPIGRYFENFYSAVGSISEEIYSQRAVYLSYTLDNIMLNYSVYLTEDSIASIPDFGVKGEREVLERSQVMGSPSIRPDHSILIENPASRLPSEEEDWGMEVLDIPAFFRK